MATWIDINQTDKDGKTALMWASFEGQEEIVKILLEKNLRHVFYNKKKSTFSFGPLFHLSYFKILVLVKRR